MNKRRRKKALSHAEIYPVIFETTTGLAGVVAVCSTFRKADALAKAIKAKGRNAYWHPVTIDEKTPENFWDD